MPKLFWLCLSLTMGRFSMMLSMQPSSCGFTTRLCTLRVSNTRGVLSLVCLCSGLKKVSPWVPPKMISPLGSEQAARSLNWLPPVPSVLKKDVTFPVLPSMRLRPFMVLTHKLRCLSEMMAPMSEHDNPCMRSAWPERRERRISPFVTVPIYNVESSVWSMSVGMSTDRLTAFFMLSAGMARRSTLKVRGFIVVRSWQNAAVSILPSRNCLMKGMKQNVEG